MEKQNNIPSHDPSDPKFDNSSQPIDPPKHREASSLYSLQHEVTKLDRLQKDLEDFTIQHHPVLDLDLEDSEKGNL